MGSKPKGSGVAGSSTREMEGANGANVPEPIGFRLRTHPHVDWFLRFVGNKWSIQKALSASLNALFRFELGPSRA